MAKTRKKKQKKIAIRSLLYLILMGIVMIIGTSIAASLQMVERDILIYEEYAYSYANMMASNVPGDLVRKYMSAAEGITGEEAAEVSTESEPTGTQPQEEDTEGYIEAGTDDPDELSEMIMMDPEYIRVFWLLTTAASFSKLRYAYVVVPVEDGKIYLWNTSHNNQEEELPEQEKSDYRQPKKVLEFQPYREGEKEAMAAVVDGSWDETLVVNSIIDNQALGSAFSPVFDSRGDVVAILGVDVDLVDLVFAILKMCLNIFLAVATILAVCTLIFYFLIRWRIIRPIVRLKKATADLVENLDSEKEFSVNIHTGDEIEALAVSFEEMDVRLKHYLKENLTITADQERMKTELDLARRIQADMLPSEFPAFPDRRDFDIFASMDPAKEVGGDFYDFFLIDDDHLALEIADVSGKGIPAALFMMMTMIMLKNLALTGMSPKDVLEKVNDQICSNHEEMFVTVWLGILDLRSGVITASNAGHEYPMLKHPDGSFEIIKDKHGLVLGAMEGIHYKEYEIRLDPGSKLFVYTDGVPEATDTQNKLFGTERTLDALNMNAGGTPRQLLEAVKKAVDEFVGEAPQFDDLTMLCLSYSGNQEEE